jgi:hypothetical protein
MRKRTAAQSEPSRASNLPPSATEKANSKNADDPLEPAEKHFLKELGRLAVREALKSAPLSSIQKPKKESM